MAGLLAYAFAGGLAGAGKGIVEEAQAARQQALDMLREERESRARMEQRDWQDRRDATERQARRVDVQEDRDWREKQAAIERQDRQKNEADRRAWEDKRIERAETKPGERFVSRDGVFMQQPVGGGSARPVMDETGKPVLAPVNLPASRSQNEIRIAIQDGMEAIRTPNDVPDVVEQLRQNGIPDEAIVPALRLRLRNNTSLTPDQINERLSSLGLGSAPAQTLAPAERPQGLRQMPQAPSAGPSPSAPLPPSGGGRNPEWQRLRNLPQPKTAAEFEALPSGTKFLDPTGTVRVKP